jgi:hypothetical protein
MFWNLLDYGKRAKMRKLDPSIRISNMGRQLTVSTLPWVLVAFSIPAVANPIDLSQLCGASDCVVSVNTTIGSASGPLTVNGNFTVNSGVALEFLVDTQINIDGNLNLQGVVGGPGNGGVGGVGGGSGLPGSPGGNAPSVVSSLFNVKGSITVGSGGVTAEGGSGGAGGDGASGQSGGSGGAGGTAGSLTFNTCQTFVSNSGAQLTVNGGNGGNGGAGQTNGAGGAGGNAGTVTINAKQTITSNASVTAVGGNGGLTGGSAGSDGAVTLVAGGTISVAPGTLDLGVNSPTISPNQSSIPSLAFCTAPPPSVPAITGITAGNRSLTVAFSARLTVLETALSVYFWKAA